MSDNLITGIVSIVLAIIGVAALALWLSPKGQGVGLINAAGGQLAQNIGVAISPVTGAMPSIGSLGSVAG
jgi:hypothetical protein